MSRRPQTVPSPWQVAKMFHEFREARAALLELDPTLADDLKLQLDYLEGQTDAFEALDTLVEASVDARMLAKAAREQAQAMAARAARFERREEIIRGWVLTGMQMLGQDKIERPGYTASTRQNPAELIIDMERLSHAYCRVKLEPDKIAIRKLLDDGVEVEGAVLGNASMGITIRT